MKKMSVFLENCYGIKKLAYDFNFAPKKTFAIYAPNGVMKTSFAKTFMDFSKKEKSKDLVFGHYKTTTRDIKDEENAELNPQEVFVIEPYNEQYKSNNVSTLLANKNLKELYDKVLSSINEKKQDLVKELIPLVGCKGNKAATYVEEHFAEDFTGSKDFFKALMRVKDEVVSNDAGEFHNIKYYEIFNDKVINFIKENAAQLENYTKRYEELVSASKYFSKGIFSHTNAISVVENLKKNGFFRANHTVILNSNNVSEKKEFASEKDLEDAIQQEMDTILNDKALQKSFEEIDKKLNKNEELRTFRDYLMSNLAILPSLKNLRIFKEKIWISYLKAKKTYYLDFEKEYNEGRVELEKIISEAKEDISAWMDVIEIFNKRFFVPFVIQIENQVDVILKSEIPNFKFFFEEQGASFKAPIEEAQLLKALSNGEKRALYILNIVFEVEARKRNGQKTLFIVDDIADSFDYKNKYAIIEYLKDIADNDNFKQIILSHNFDFYRSVCGRLGLPRTHKLHASKTITEINLLQEKYQKNPFNHWRKNLQDEIMLVAAIPFVRNLAEYSGHDLIYNHLTSLLHIKSQTDEVSLQNLYDWYGEILVEPGFSENLDTSKKVKDLIYECADKLLYDQTETPDLENKIVLSISIRLKAEEYMMSQLTASRTKLESFSEQTITLFMEYKKEYPLRTEDIKILEQVILMTPENIHINSFMYEPILDMSIFHLQDLYNKIKNLK